MWWHEKKYWNSLIWVFHIFTEYTLVAYVTSNNCDKSGIKQLRYNINAWSGYVHVNHSWKCFKQIIILTFINGSKWKHSSSTVSCYSRHKILHNNVFYQLHNIFTKKDEPYVSEWLGMQAPMQRPNLWLNMLAKQNGRQSAIFDHMT